MTGPILAHVRRVLIGHSDRALVHAVDDAGLEYKIEVPAEAVRGYSADRGHALLVSWSLLALPRAAEASTPATSTPGTPEPAAAPDAQSRPQPTAGLAPTTVDAAFMALMNRTRAPEPTMSSTPPPSPASTSPEQQIAALLGLAPRGAD